MEGGENSPYRNEHLILVNFALINVHSKALRGDQIKLEQFDAWTIEKTLILQNQRGQRLHEINFSDLLRYTLIVTEHSKFQAEAALG